MAHKHVVDLSKLREYLIFRDQINSLPLESIDWQVAGQSLIVDMDEVKDWKFMGLSNTMFAEINLINMPE